MSIADIVNTWARERLATGAIARDTDAYNQVFSAVPDLITMLESASETPAEAPAEAPAEPPASPEQ